LGAIREQLDGLLEEAARRQLNLRCPVSIRLTGRVNQVDR